MALSLATAPLSFAGAAAPRANVKMSFSDEVTFTSKPWTSSEISDKAGLEAVRTRPVCAHALACRVSRADARVR